MSGVAEPSDELRRTIIMPGLMVSNAAVRPVISGNIASRLSIHTLRSFTVTLFLLNGVVKTLILD